MLDELSKRLEKLQEHTSASYENIKKSTDEGIREIRKDPTSKKGSQALLYGFIVVLGILILVYVLFFRDGGLFSGGGSSGGGGGGGGGGDGNGGGEYVDEELGKPDDPFTVEQLILYGQSLSIGVNSTPLASSTQSNPDNVLTLKGGPVAGQGPGLIPLTEVKSGIRSGESPASALGNAYFLHYLKAQKNRKVIVIAPGEGSQTVAALSSPPLIDRYKTRARQVFKDAKTKFPDAKTIKQPVICWVQGEADRSGSSEEGYKAALTKLVRELQDFSLTVGNTKAVFLSYQTSFGSASGSPVMQAQFQLHKEGKIQIVTPIYHLPLANDGIHLSSRGSQMLGAYFARGANCVRRGKKVPLTTPISAKIDGNKVIVKFEVPVKPLKFSSEVVAKNKGFEISGASITNVLLGESGDEVIIEATGLTVGKQLRYAMTKGRNIALGQVMDSCEETVPIGTGGADVKLVNYAPHFVMDMS